MMEQDAVLWMTIHEGERFSSVVGDTWGRKVQFCGWRYMRLKGAVLGMVDRVRAVNFNAWISLHYFKLNCGSAGSIHRETTTL